MDADTDGSPVLLLFFPDRMSQPERLLRKDSLERHGAQGGWAHPPTSLDGADSYSFSRGGVSAWEDLVTVSERTLATRRLTNAQVVRSARLLRRRGR